MRMYVFLMNAILFFSVHVVHSFSSIDKDSLSKEIWFYFIWWIRFTYDRQQSIAVMAFAGEIDR